MLGGPLGFTAALTGAAIGWLVIAVQFETPHSGEVQIDGVAAMSRSQPAAIDTPPAPAEGAAPQASAGAPADTPSPKAAETAGSGGVLNGWKQYEVNCSRCHGQDALGSAIAPDLRKSLGGLGHAAFVQVVKEGRPQRGMPGFAAQLEDAQINDIVAYLSARASGELGPGRPGSG